MRAVVFDMDGLMVDSEKIYWAVGRGLAREFGREISEQTLGRMMGRAPLESMTVFARELEIERPPSELLEIREARVLEQFRSGVDPMPGLMDAILALHAKYRLAIATGARREMVDAVLARLNVLRYFSVVQTSDDVTHGKPDPEIYLKAIARLEVRPEETVVLEDSWNGALAGKRAGAYVIAVPSVHTRQQDFSFADYVAADLIDAVARIRAIDPEPR